MPENNLWKTFVDFVENFFQQYYPHTYQHQMWKTKLNVEKLWEISKYKDINFCGKVKKNNITICTYTAPLTHPKPYAPPLAPGLSSLSLSSASISHLFALSLFPSPRSFILLFLCLIFFIISSIKLQLIR